MGCTRLRIAFARVLVSLGPHESFQSIFRLSMNTSLPLFRSRFSRLARYVVIRARARRTHSGSRRGQSLTTLLAERFQRAVSGAIRDHLSAGRSIAVEINGELQVLRLDREASDRRQSVSESAPREK